MSEPESNLPGAVDWAHRAGATGELMAELARLQSARKRRRTIAAAAGVVLGAATLAFLAAPARKQGSSKTLAVSVPETGTLPDGSRFEARDGTRVVEKYSWAERRVVVEAGAAHFEVTRESRRPFVVLANGVEVRALGTAFSVELKPAGVEVIVTGGKVSLSREGAARPVAMLEAGEQVLVPPAGDPEVPAVKLLNESEMREQLAWRIPRLEFSRTPLLEAVEMFNRYNDVRLVIDDPAIGALQVSGFSRADRVEGFLVTVETNFGIRVERAGREIHLKR